MMRPQTPLVLFNSGLWPVSWVVAGIQWCQLVKEAHISFVGFLRHARAHTFGMWPESQPWWRWKWQQSAALLTRRRLACGWWSWVPQQCWSDVKIPKMEIEPTKEEQLTMHKWWMNGGRNDSYNITYLYPYPYLYLYPFLARWSPSGQSFLFPDDG